jgi:hypothetical protein
MKTTGKNTGANWKDSAQDFARRAGRETRDAMDNPLFGFIAWLITQVASQKRWSASGNKISPRSLTPGEKKNAYRNYSDLCNHG